MSIFLAIYLQYGIINIMSFDKNYPNRKDHRKPHRGSKAISPSCKNHGGCPRCESGRQRMYRKAELDADEQLTEWKEEEAMQYPTPEQVENASRVQICRWYRFLKSPETPEQIDIMDDIVERFNELGGMTP